MTATTPAARRSPAILDQGYLRDKNRLEELVGPEWYNLLKGLVTNPLTLVGLILVLVFILVALFAPLLVPAPTENWDPYMIPRDGFFAEPRPPGTTWDKNVPAYVPAWYKFITGNEEWTHIMGTTSGQYDIWYGIIWGTRTALIAGSFVAIASVTIGVIIGALAGYYGGWVDEVLMRVVEIFIAFPFLVGALILASLLTPMFGRSIWPTIIALIIFGWTGYARLIRGDILATKEREYVTAARASGAGDGHLVMRHVLPNAIFPTMVRLSLDFGAVVLSFAALSFLGVGVPEGYADWGQIISFARSWILSLNTHWYIIVFPGLALLVYGLAWNLIGDGLRDILDPQMRGSR